ncbi:MAG: L-seryl-tRNA(Sec) selenium transferase [Fusobacteriaceae bacterium]
MDNELLKKLPKVDKLLAHKELETLAKETTYYVFVETIKSGIEFFRNRILAKEILSFTEEDVLEKIKALGQSNKLYSLRKVINGTGTIIHTNLGRSLMSTKMIENMSEISLNYNNLEYDLQKGRRGSRYSHLESLICKITGGERALVVNNNAAAVIICLNEFSKEAETIVSRGELVEIGGSFRIPDIMSLSGTNLVEVGTTNRTHKIDYEKAITENTNMLLKVHSSNYKMSGFVSSVTVEEIAQIGKEKNLITMEDIGSGILIDLSKYGMVKEPSVQESIKAGIDIVTFSGDKLLGGPQAGIIVGKKELIERLLKNQYLRAFRMNKNSIALLEVVFSYYLDEREAIKEIPTLRMILEPKENVYKRAENLKKLLEENLINSIVIETRAKIGGGSMPEETVPSYGLSFLGNANYLEEKFRLNEPAVIGRIYDNSFVIDMKTIQESDFHEISEIVKKIMKKK